MRTDAVPIVKAACDEGHRYAVMYLPFRLLGVGSEGPALNRVALHPDEARLLAARLENAAREAEAQGC